MAHLAMALLGQFQVTLDCHPVEGLTSDRLRALLAFLAVESRRRHPRDALAALLWPDRPDREALSALRYALSNLRGVLDDRSSPNPFLLVTRSSVQFNAASDYWLDLAEFQSLANLPDVADLERALSLYRGPFLDGLSVSDSPAFEQWLLLQGEETRRSVLALLGRLTSLQMAHGEYAEAARWARRQLELEPYREQAHRQFMAALALGGERSAALAHYEACHRLLVEDLGCEPEDETQVLYAQIQSGTIPRPGPALHVTGSPLPPGSQGTQPPSRFVAREQQLARLGVLLDGALAGQGGVAFIVGEAGAGKSALLDQFAQQAAEAHGDLIALRGRCNAHGGAGDPYLPFREILQMLAGDVEGKRAGGTLSVEHARRAWEALPAVGSALAEHGPGLIDTFVPGEALLRRVEGFPSLGSADGWQARLREIVCRAGEGAEPAAGAGVCAPAPQIDLFAQVTQVLRAVSRHSPLLLVVDDLQWADGGTAALLFHLGRRLAGSRILLACACRPEALSPGSEMEAGHREGPAVGVATVLRELCRKWGDVLVDLDQADGRAFVEDYVDSEPNRLGAAFRQTLYGYTGGNPLFTIELLRDFERAGALVQDEGGRWVEAPNLDWDRWPPQVESVIAGHLGGLPYEDRALLQAASVQGEQFVAEVAARVLDWGEEAALRRLSGPLRTRHRLVEAVSLDRLPSSGQRLSRYRFRHSLLQRSAYRSLDVVQRARLHEATARALEAISAPAGQSLALAQHYEAAGMPLEAARYRLAAGRWAAKLVAYKEALAHLERGLSLLEGVAASRERLHLELALTMALGTPAMLQQGWRAPVYTRALERLSDLVQHPDLQDEPQRLAALCVLALSTGWSADPERSGRVGEQLLGLAREGDRHSLMLGHWALGLSHWMRGRFVPAREHLTRAVALDNSEANRPLGGLVAADPGVMAHAMLGAVQWQLGYPDQARASFRQAVVQAQALEQPSSLAFAHFVAVMINAAVGRNAAAALSHCQALQSLGQVGLVYGVWAELLAALARAPTEASGQAQDGQAAAITPDPELEQAVARAMEALSTWQAAGSGAGFAGLLLLQAELCTRASHPEIGLAAMDQAQAWIEHTGMRATEAETWRVRGELLLIDRPASSGQVQEAEACFRCALAVAREQESRWWELGAALSLARLWQAQGRREEARGLLAGIYGWFTEGFDTADLVEAQTILEELS